MGLQVTLRSYQDGDEVALARIFTAALARFVGPLAVQPGSWLAQWQPSWRGPGLQTDPDCLRVAVCGEHPVGYSAASYRDHGRCVVHDLCTCGRPGCEHTADLLLEDIEERARRRGCSLVTLESWRDEAQKEGAGRARGYEFGPDGSVFMACVTSLHAFLRELAPALTERLNDSYMAGWQGTLALKSGAFQVGLRVVDGEVAVVAPCRPTVEVHISPEWLPLLLLGRETAEEGYLQDALALRSGRREEALPLLAVLFPRLPLALPRAQWW